MAFTRAGKSIRRPSGAQGAPSAPAALPLAAKLLRMVLVFALAFFTTLHVQSSLAYGEEGTDDANPAEVGTTGESETNGEAGEGSDLEPSSNPDSTSSDPDTSSPEPSPQPSDATPSEHEPSSEQPASYSFVKSIEIVQEDGTSFHADKREMLIEGKPPARYRLVARVIVVPDSNAEELTYEYLVTPDNDLASQTDNVLPDLTWEIYTVEKNPKWEQEMESSSTTTEPEFIDVAVPADIASIDKATGELVVAGEAQFKIRCTSDAGKHLSGETSVSYVRDNMEVVATGKEKEEEQEETKKTLAISYDANGGTGQMQPSETDPETGLTTVAENGFTAPDKKEFDSWNTQADGQGTAYAPGATIDPNQETGEAAQPLDNTDAPEAGSPQPPAQAADAQQHMTLYAIWKDTQTEEEPAPAKPSGEMSNPRVTLTYTPTPMGQIATLSPVISGMGHGEFAYIWQRSTDGGKTWDFIESTGVQSMQVMTNDETIGHQYRVSVLADKVLNPTTGSHLILSEPVEISADENPFKIVLSYEPVEEGQTAQFSVTSTELDATYQWQVSHDGGATWEVLKDATGMSYAVETTQDNLGSWYRVKATRGSSAASTEGQSSSTGKEAEEAQSSSSAQNPSSQDEASSAEGAKEGRGDQAEPSSEEPKNTHPGNAGDFVYSNIQMLVAVVPDAEAEPLEDLLTTDDLIALIGEDAFDQMNSPQTPESTPSPSQGDTPAQDPYETPYAPETEPYEEPYDEPYEPYTPEAYEPTEDPYEQEYQEPTYPAPQPQPYQEQQQAPQQTPAPQPTPLDVDMVVDPEVTEQIAQEQAAQQMAPQPGERWSELSVMPKQEEIDLVLDDNPFAPLAIPSGVGLVACGMLEKLFAFRRQTRPSSASFALAAK